MSAIALDGVPERKLAKMRERFAAKVKQMDIPGPGMETPCLEWQQWRNRRGYGQFSIIGKKHQAHRVSWALEHGSVPDDMCVLHHCDNPSCVRVEHLFLGTNADNSADMVKKGRQRAPSGSRHRYALYPESIARGDKHWTHVRPELTARGERHGCSKMTEASVRSVFELHGNGWLHKDIAEKFHISPRTVSDILSRRTWKFVRIAPSCTVESP